jgi:hypothetical protein
MQGAWQAGEGGAVGRYQTGVYPDNPDHRYYAYDGKSVQDHYSLLSPYWGAV